MDYGYDVIRSELIDIYSDIKNINILERNIMIIEDSY